VYVTANGQNYTWNPSLSAWVPWFNSGSVLRANITGAATANIAGRGAAELTLTGNVTSLTISGWDTDTTKIQRVRFRIVQDTTGGRTFTPSGVNGTWLETPPSTLPSTASATVLQFYAVTTDGGTTVWLEPLGIATATYVTVPITGDGATTVFTVTHNLGLATPFIPLAVSALDPAGDLLSASSYQIDNLTANSFRVTFAVAPANAAVHRFKITAELTAATTASTSGLQIWTTGTFYTTGNHVNSGDRIYRALANHTAGATFAGDTANWVEVSKVGTAGAAGDLQYRAATGDALASTTGLNFAAGALTVPNLAVTGTAVVTANTSPAAPATGTMALWTQNVGNRPVPLFKGALSADTMLQASIARGKVGVWLPGGAGSGGGSIPGVWGYNAYTTIGTTTGRTCGATNLFTRQRRVGFVSAVGAGQFASVRTGGIQVTVGTGTAGVGGFFKLCRFGCSDTASVAGARQFLGVMNSTVAPTNVEPSTLTNVIGVGHGAADTNLFIYYGGTTAQIPIDLGANFPANTLSVDLYELVLYAPSASATGDVFYQVTRCNTGHVASGTLANSGAAVLPTSSLFLNYQYAWRCNNASALAVGLDFISDYIEIDV
jgi:hypothetical protein